MTWLQFVIAACGITLSLSLIMALAWLVQQRTGNSGWVDTAWSFGVGLVGFASALVPLDGEFRARQWVVAALAAIWAARLGVHIAQRSSGISDDPRYAKMIKDWGDDAPRQMFIFLQQQAIVSVVLVLAMFVAAHNPAPGLRLQDFAAIALLLVAVAGEGLSDWQLTQFKSDPANKGRINDVGLWSWSRHPNYFFETLGWLAYPLIAIDLAYPWGWLALAAPACMYWLLVYVSGIPPLEEHMLRTRGDAFRAYQRRTNAFFPAPPRKTL